MNCALGAPEAVSILPSLCGHLALAVGAELGTDWEGFVEGTV